MPLNLAVLTSPALAVIHIADPNDPGHDFRGYSPLHDANFNVLGLVDDQGDLVERYEYRPYGERQVYLSPGVNDPEAHAPTQLSRRVETYGWVTQPYGLNEFGHQGLLHDEETGLVYNRARMLHPRLGRFMQRDPLGYVDGFNLYEYVRSSPLGFVDPLGLQGEPFGGFILNAVVKAPGAAKDVISDTAKEVALPVGFHLGLVDETDLLAESGLAQAVAARSVQGQGDVRIAAGLGLDVARHANPESLGQRIAFAFVAGLVTRDSDRSSRAIAEGVLTLSPFVASKGSTIFGRGVRVVRGPCQVRRVSRNSVGPGHVAVPKKMFHFTDDATAELIEKSQLGLRGRTIFLTPNGHLSPLQAQIELALPQKNTVTALFEVTTKGLDTSKIILRRRTTGNVLNRPGGGTEILFDGPIPLKNVRRVR